MTQELPLYDMDLRIHPVYILRFCHKNSFSIKTNHSGNIVSRFVGRHTVITPSLEIIFLNVILI